MRQRSSGSTLIEALAGMALLGGLLVAIVMAGAQLTAQRGRAERRVTACRLADQLLESWWANKDTLPRHGTGPVSNNAAWVWRTQLVENAEAASMQALVVALEVAPAGQPEQPAVHVEVVVPMTPDERNLNAQ